MLSWLSRYFAIFVIQVIALSVTELTHQRHRRITESPNR